LYHAIGKSLFIEFTSSWCKNNMVQTFHNHGRLQLTQKCSSGCHKEGGSWEDQADEGIVQAVTEKGQKVGEWVEAEVTLVTEVT
jgi:hypothetical protein